MSPSSSESESEEPIKGIGQKKVKSPASTRKELLEKPKKEASSDESSSSSSSSSEDEEEEEESSSSSSSDSSSSSSSKEEEKHPKQKKEEKPQQTTSEKNAEQYAIDLIKYLKAHGKTKMAALGGKVKKPQSITMKFKDFVKMRPDEFKISGEDIELA